MKTKLLGALIAGGGVVATTVGAFALYTSVANEKKIGIGVVTSSGEDVKYTVTNVVAPTKALNPTDNTDTFSFDLGATYNEEGDNFYQAQDIVTGNYKIEITGSATLISNLTVKGSIAGYVEGSIGATNYGSEWTLNANEAGTALTASNNVAVKAAGQKATYTVTLNKNISQEDFLAIAEETYNINVTWTLPSEDFTFAYLTGDFCSWQTGLAGLQMNPAIDDTVWNWIIQYKFDKEATVKATSGTTWDGASANDKTFTAGSHTLRWTGFASDDVYEL